MTTSETTIKGFAAPEQAGGYLHLPFDAPPGTVRIDVSYRYDSVISAAQGVSGGNTVDIGIFDQRGVGFNSEGFRGWSGSDRASFFIGRGEASPGYMPGPIDPGTWYIILGLYKMASGGCNYQVTVRLERDLAARPSAFPPLLTMEMAGARPPKPDGWYRGELHCHTVHSDGDSTPAEVIAAAEALGLDFLAITDHNILMHLADEARLQASTRLILIPGFEVTTYKGHWNIWGGQGWVDFRIQTPEQLARSVEQAKQQGYLTSLNHPHPYGPDWEFGRPYGNEIIEVWNGPWPKLNATALAFWDALLRAGERIPAVGGSDMHRMKRPGEMARLANPTTWIYCPGTPTASALLQGVREGHVFVNEGPDGPQLYLSSSSAMMGDVLNPPADGKLPVKARVVNGRDLALELWGGEGCMATFKTETDDQTFDLTLPMANTPYVRAQLIDPHERIVRALTNPLYLR